MHDLSGQPTELAGLAERLARGVSRRLANLGYGTMTEFPVGKGRRVDVVGLNKDSRFVIVEIKTSENDYRTDHKWQEYLPYCDEYFFAVPAEFPREILPGDHGLIIADAYDATIVRPSAALPMNPSRRRAQILRFGLAASRRLHHETDPRPGARFQLRGQ